MSWEVDQEITGIINSRTNEARMMFIFLWKYPELFSDLLYFSGLRFPFLFYSKYIKATRDTMHH